MSDVSLENQPTVAGYEIVANLLVRQEQVLEELEVLNSRIEATIKSITEARQLEAANSAIANDEMSSATASPAETAPLKAA